MASSTSVKKIGTKILSPIKEFINDSRAVGITLIVCTIVSLIVSNSNWGGQYLQFWAQDISLTAPKLHLPHSILHLVNDGLMAVFFFLVGLEIKRELMVGELASFKKSLLPIVAAIGGMFVPALLYQLWCGQSLYSHGWAIPMATDIAFSLGVLSLLGNKAPLSFRIFLTALAIIDDLGGILTIAIFYAKQINTTYLMIGGSIMIILIIMNLLKVKWQPIYFILGLLLWYVVFNSGIHATVAGVLLAFTIPLRKIEVLEHTLHNPVNFIILPIFALANTAIILPVNFSNIFLSDLHHGIFSGLVLGKPIGILLFSFIAIKLRVGSLPEGMNFKHLLGIGMIAGIGFTMSIFIATLAFSNPEFQLTAKVSIISASFLAGIIGYLYLRFLKQEAMG